MSKAKQFLQIVFQPYSLVFLTSSLAITSQVKKKRSQDESVYNILKDDTVNVYNQSLDQTKQQPLIDLLKRKSTELDPELKKRLELYAEWQKDSLWTLAYNYFLMFGPVYFGVVQFPTLAIYGMAGFAFATTINYENEKDTITGGKMKSYFVKDLIPKQEKVQKYFTYFGYGVLSLALLKIGLMRYQSKLNNTVINEWRKKNRK